MLWKIKKLLNSLEDPNYPCLGPLLRLMSLTGLWHPDLKALKPRLKLIFFYIIVAYFFTQYIKFALFYSHDALNLLLQYAPFHMGVLKAFLFQKNYKRWAELIQFISSIERKQILENDDEKDKIISGYILWSRKVFYFFVVVVFLTNFSIFTEPYQTNQVAENGTINFVFFDAYTPFRNEPAGYYFSMFIQTVFGNMISIYIICWDMLTVFILIFFGGQLRISGLSCSRVIDLKYPENSKRNIAICHEFHMMLVLYQKKFNALISSVMFAYLVNVSVNLGVCIKQIAEFKDDLSSLVASCMFVGACLVQLLLFYWHANDVTVESERVSYSTLKCDWVEADCRLQRQVILLAWTTSKRLAFKAGPFNEMTLSTFVSILRGSYSFYTLLNGTN